MFRLPDDVQSGDSIIDKIPSEEYNKNNIYSKFRKFKEKEMKKKLISLFMSALMILQCLTITTAAEDTVPAVPVYTYNGHTYQIFDVSMTWQDAKTYCEDVGGHLVTITSSDEQEFIEQLLGNAPKKQYWLGMSKVSGSMAWVTGEAVSYTNWDSGEPNSDTSRPGYQEMYIHILNAANPAVSGSRRFKWNDMYYDNTFPNEESFFSLEYVGFICEWDSSSDYDGDAIFPEEIRKNQKNSLTIQVSDTITDAVISGASVSLDGQEKTTDTKGQVSFTAPESDTAALSISADGYTDISIEDYSAYKTGAFDAFELYPEGYTAIVPVSCNGKSIGTGSALINTEAPLTASIKIKGVSASEIEKFELVQGTTVLASSSDGAFSIANSSFRTEVPVTAKMYTADGKITSHTLNIDVISVGMENAAPPFTNQELSVKTSDNDLIDGFWFKAAFASCEVQIDIGNDSIKVGYNHVVKNKDLSRINKDFRKLFEELNMATPSSDFTLFFGGYVVVSLDKNGVNDVEGTACLTGRYKNQLGKTVLLPFVITIPIRLEIQFRLDGILEILNFGYDFENAKIIWPDGVDFLVKGQLKGSVGVGGKIASAGVYGKLSAELKMNIIPDFLIEHLYGYGEFGLYAKADLGFWKPETRVILADNKENPLILYQNSSAASASLNSASETLASLYTADSYQLNSREYLSSMSAWDETVTNGDLQTGTYDSADPQIVSAGGVTLMVFPSDNGGSDDYNFQQLVYSVRTDGGWSTPVPVDSNDLVDADFTLCTNGSEIWLAYTQANRLFTEMDAAEDYAAAMEIAVVSYDFETGAFTEPVVLTSNDTYDMNPEIAVIDGIVTLAWVNNADNHLSGMTDHNTVYAMEYCLGWLTEEPVVVAENVPAVTSLAVGTYDGLDRMIALVCDTDNDFTTTDDSILMQFETNIIQWRLLNEFTDANYTGLTFFDGYLYLNSNGDILTMEKNGLMHVVLTNADVSANYQLLTRNDMLHIVYSADDPDSEEGGSRLYVNVQIDDTWKTDEVILPLTDNTGYIDSFDVIEADGSLLTVYRRTDVTFTEDSFTTASDLCVQYETDVSELRITGIQYDEEDLFGDTAVTLTVSVTNSGLADAKGYTLTVGGNESLYFEESISSGATAEAVIEYTMLESDGAEVTVLLTDENGIPDTADVTLGYADYSAEAEAMLIAGTPYASITIRNNGSMEDSAIVTVTAGDADGEMLYTESISLISGAQEHILLEILDDTIKTVYVTVTADSSEYFNGDNHASCMILYAEAEEEKPVYGDINADGVRDAADGELFAAYFAGYAVELCEDSADLDGDGTLTRRDAMILARHLAEWNGYALPYSE